MLILENSLFRHAIDQAYDAVLITTAALDSPEPKIVYVNPAFCKQTGYTAEELLGLTPRILQGPKTDRAVLDRLRTTIAHGGVFEGQAINYRKDGTPYRVHWNISPVLDEQEHITHYVSVQRDITDIHAANAELTRQSHLLNMAEKTAQFGGWFADLEKNRVVWSNVVAEIHGMPLGYSPSIEQSMDFFAPEYKALVKKRFLACVEQGVPYDEEWEIINQNKQRVWVRTHGEPVRDEHNRIIRVQGAFQDITSQREKEQALRKLAYITDHSPAPTTVTDLEGRIEYVNRAFEQVSGYRNEELVGKTPAYVKGGNTPDTTYQDLWETITAGKVWRGELQNRRKDGTPYWEHEVIAPLTDALGKTTHYVAIKQDITEQKLAEQELQKIAFRDQLTGLYTLTGFTRHLQQHIDQYGWNPEGAVLTIDITGLRDVNDVFGYEDGDQLLIEFSRRLKAQTGLHGVAGRIGGDEFTVCIFPEDTKPLRAYVKQLVEVLSAPFSSGDGKIKIVIRLGYTCFGNHPRPVQDLLRESEQALFQHRMEPSAPWIAYDVHLREKSQERITLTHELHQALDQEQFELHFQPKVDLATGRLIACEALIRWNHPERGLLSPGVFISIAEQSQLIGPIGDWVLRRACQYLRDWREAGLEPVRVAVNVSVVQFQRGDFAKQVQTVLEQSGVAPEELALEITESVFEKESDVLLNQMRTLRDMGVRLSLDDFGTGYSSLLYLQRYPFDEIKIDQGFVFRLLDDPFSHSIVDMVMRLAKAMKAEVIAEGIESMAVSRELQTMGCQSGQGYFYSMPLEAEDFRWLLEQRSSLPLNTCKAT